LYYDKKDPMYSTVADLLNQYTLACSKLSLQAVDYLRDPLLAQKTKAEYKLASSTDKNLILFDCAGWVIKIDGDVLTRFGIESVPDEKQRVFRKKPIEFEGETHFSAALLAVTNPKVLNAYFLQRHREHPLDSGGDFGYLKFASLLAQNHIRAQPLDLLG